MLNLPVHHFSVCPHDTAKKQTIWFLLNTYLQRKLQVRMRFEPKNDVAAECDAVLASPHHLDYANPMSAMRYADQGYVPVARATGLNDETFVVAREGANVAQMERPIHLASASERVIIHHLGLTLLPRLGLRQDDVTVEFSGNYVNALNAVSNGSAQLAFVFNETWDSFSAASRQGLEVLARTEQGQAFHTFMVGPQWIDRLDSVREILCDMNHNPAGREILDELEFQAIEPVGAEALENMRELLRS